MAKSKAKIKEVKGQLKFQNSTEEIEKHKEKLPLFEGLQMLQDKYVKAVEEYGSKHGVKISVQPTHKFFE